MRRRRQVNLELVTPPEQNMHDSIAAGHVAGIWTRNRNSYNSAPRLIGWDRHQTGAVRRHSAHSACGNRCS
jgi:hypothetical protein